MSKRAYPHEYQNILIANAFWNKTGTAEHTSFMAWISFSAKQLSSTHLPLHSQRDPHDWLVSHPDIDLLRLSRVLHGEKGVEEKKDHKCRWLFDSSPYNVAALLVSSSDDHLQVRTNIDIR